ncbi:N-6 DNA methylase [Curtobacterium flaccumfaciens pv. flaccumfaciens]
MLHALASLKSTGKAAVILPHGVLFRGNAEGNIRRELLKRGFIKGVIGLPANLFYGTGIPACIVLLDKENAVSRTGVFMVDASKGFIKDGNKNRLRDQDIHKIVDACNRQVEIDGYSRMVPMTELSAPRNDYNLNIPRYIDGAEPEDIQDLSAHLSGGIPNRDIDALQSYWDALPSLKDQLFEPLREDYSHLKVDLSEIQEYALHRSGLESIRAKVQAVVNDWFEANRPALLNISTGTKPNGLIATLGDDLLARFKEMPLLDEYDVYQQLMSYWNGTMHDDVFLIMTELGNGGTWASAAKPRKTIEDKERKLSEEPDFEIGSGRSKTRYKMDLVPPDLVVARYFADEQARVDELDANMEYASAAMVEHAEEHGADEALLAEATNDKGTYTRPLVSAVVREARVSGDQDTFDCANAALELVNREAAAKRAVKEAQAALDESTLRKYGELTDEDVKSVVLDDKWHATIATKIDDEVGALTIALVERVHLLGTRYAVTLGGSRFGAREA